MKQLLTVDVLLQTNSTEEKQSRVHENTEFQILL